MKVDISMIRDEDKLSVGSWWATSPEFVLYALGAQLESAKAIWPDSLSDNFICVKKPAAPPQPPPSTSAQTADPLEASNKLANILARFFPGPEVDEVWRAMDEAGLRVVYSSSTDVVSSPPNSGEKPL